MVWLSFLLDLCIIFSQVLKICCILTAIVVRLQHYKGGKVAFKRFIHISQLPHMLDWIIIISDNGLLPDWHQTITRIQRRNLINSQCLASRYGTPNTTGWIPEYFGVFLCRLTVFFVHKTYHCLLFFARSWSQNRKRTIILFTTRPILTENDFEQQIAKRYRATVIAQSVHTFC